MKTPTPSGCKIWMCCIIFLVLFHIDLSAQECCFIPECKAQAIVFADTFTILTSTFGEAPVGKDSTLSRLNRIKSGNREQYDAFMSNINEFNSWSLDHSFAINCFTTQTLTKPNGDNTIQWVNEAISLGVKTKFRSSQFCRGFRFQMEAGLGAANLGKQSESFYSTLRALVSYTFAPNDPAIAGDPSLEHCNGRIRLLAGLSEAYISQKGITQGVLRAEIRLRDFAADPLGAFANIKLILQGSQGITRNMTSLGGGIGLEFELGSINLLYERHHHIANSSIQLNMAYRFK